MKAFVAFVVILFLAIGGAGGFWAWKKWTKDENWGLALSLGSELAEGEKEKVEERYNQVLDQEDILRKAIEDHDLSSYYGVSSSEDAVEKLREDTFVEIHGNNSMHILFRGKRSTRKEREAAIRTLSEDFLKEVQRMSGR
ncbi:MAG: hypothetical protein ACSHYB_13215 [Roseibacillus sp.]